MHLQYVNVLQRDMQRSLMFIGEVKNLREMRLSGLLHSMMICNGAIEAGTN